MSRVACWKPWRRSRRSSSPSAVACSPAWSSSSFPGVPYLEIALELGGARGDRLTYSGPDEIEWRAGALVVVSVRGRQVPGVVLREVEKPEFETHDVDDLV